MLLRKLSKFTYTFARLNFLSIVIFCAGCNLCQNEIGQEIISPDKKLKVVSFTRDCGATTAFYTQVSIIDADEKLSNETGNVLILNDNSSVQLIWKDNTHLTIRYPFTAKTSLREETIDGISISYSDTSGEAVALDPIKYFSSFPTEQLEELADVITKGKKDQLISQGSSENWKRIDTDAAKGIITIQNDKDDSRLVFQLFTPVDEEHVRAATYQQFSQARNLAFWELDNRKWKSISYRLPALTKFIGKESYTNSELNKMNLLPYLNFEFRRDTILMTLNDFLFAKELINQLNLSESTTELDASNYFAYKNAFVWSVENGFTTEQIADTGYSTEADMQSSEVKADPNADPDAPAPMDWACPHEVALTVSSELKPQGGASYVKANLLDASFATAWVEGANDSGLKESVEFRITGTALIGESYLFVNGYAKSEKVWKENNRVRKLRCFVNDTPVSIISLLDTRQLQQFNISPWWLNRRILKKGDRIRFEILEIYKGDRYDDTAISLFVPDGNCG